MYTEHYKAFSQNINFAARILHYYLQINGLANGDKDNYNALNRNARFWSDYNFMALQTVIIFLGKIFDSQNKTHNLTKLLEVLPKSLEYFSKKSLRVRKVRDGGEFEGLDGYIENAHELCVQDIEEINTEAKKAIELWEKIEPLRHQFYAHHQMLTNEQRDALFKNVTYDDLENLVQILLNIANVLEQAEINGHKPDFSDDYSYPENQAEDQINKVLKLLVTGARAPAT